MRARTELHIVGWKTPVNYAACEIYIASPPNEEAAAARWNSRGPFGCQSGAERPAVGFLEAARPAAAALFFIILFFFTGGNFGSPLSTRDRFVS